MGIQLLDNYNSIYGFTLQNVYISTANSLITVEKRDDKYYYSCSFSVHSSKQARDEGKPIIGRENIRHESVQPIDNCVYNILYAQLKSKYPNSIDN